MIANIIVCFFFSIGKSILCISNKKNFLLVRKIKEIVATVETFLKFNRDSTKLHPLFEMTYKSARLQSMIGTWMCIRHNAVPFTSIGH